MELVYNVCTSNRQIIYIMIERIERTTYHILFLALILLPMFVMIFDTIFYI